MPTSCMHDPHTKKGQTGVMIIEPLLDFFVFLPTVFDAMNSNSKVWFIYSFYNYLAQLHKTTFQKLEVA